MSAHCPSCGAKAGEPFYRVRGAPVHDVLLMPTREDAVNHPRGDIALVFCGHCGFIFNAAFDAAAVQYSARCEETQGFSSTFNAFARSLAARLVERYSLRNKHILEIGCGKGEFIALLCELGNNTGTAFDPAFVPERAPAGAAGRVRFVQAYYGPHDAGVEADFVCCRHTLEHIARTGQFVRVLADSKACRQGAPVFVEVPDVTSILREGAFWDIYYEHCSYFSPGSIGRLFRACGFQVVELYLDYGDQYIMLTARLAGRPAPPHPLEEGIAELEQAVEQFRQTSARKIQWWRERLEAWASKGASVAIWGAASKGVSFLTTLGVRDEVQCAVDVNPYKQGMFMPGTGHRVVGPRDLPACSPDYVVVMNPIYCDEIRRDLDALGIAPELVPVTAGPA